MYTIRYTHLAEADLAKLFQLIYEDKPDAALSFLDKLDAFISLLAEHPKMGVECKKKKLNKGCRVLIYEEYLIFYSIDESAKEIIILRILNSRNAYHDHL